MELESLIQTVSDYAGVGAREPLTLACKIATNAHEGFRRLNGEPFINHPLAVAGILANWHAAPDIVAVGLLHDILTPNYSHVHRLEAIEHELLPEWLSLLDAITKLNGFIRRFEGDFNKDTGSEGDLSREANVNILLHDALSMIHNHDAFIIKIADRLHNLQTVTVLDREHQKRTAKVILNIFAPLADRFGMGEVKRQLEDQSFKVILPSYYADLADYLASPKLKVEIEDIISAMKQAVIGEQADCNIYWQPFSLYTIYHRQLQLNDWHEQMLRDRLLSLQLEHMGSFILLTDKDRKGCYQLLGELHCHYKYVNKQLRDYISVPKANGYHAIHTPLMYTNGHHINCIIRTFLMDIVAIHGYTAPWHGWHIPNEYAPTLPSAERPAPGEIVVYTPQGDEKYLPLEATPLDFAYEVHADLGDHCSAAFVNGKPASLYSPLHNKDVVEIQISENVSPTPEWLKHVVTSHAKNRIRHALTTLDREKMEKRGRTLLDQALQPLGLTSSDREVISILTRIALQENLEEPDDVLAALGAGRWTVEKLTDYIRGVHSAHYVAPATPVQILELEYAGLRYDFARCCKPELTDAIVANLLRKNQTLRIHTASCRNARRATSLVKVEWDTTPPEPDYIIVLEAEAKSTLLAGIGRVLEFFDIAAETTEHWRQDGILMDVEIRLGHTTKLQRETIERELRSLPIIKNVEIIHISEKKARPKGNPYTMNPATGKQFYGRDEEYGRLVSLLSHEQNSTILLWGLHGIGKTSLLRRIAEQKQDNFLPVYIDLLDCAGCSLPHFIHKLMQKIHNQLKTFDQETLHGVRLPSESHLASHPLDSFDHFLEHGYKLLNYRPLVIIFDELQSLMNEGPNDTASRVAMFNHIHSLSQQGYGLHFVLCGNGRPENFLGQGSLSSLLTSSYPEPLSYLKHEDAFRLVTEGLSSVARFDSDEPVHLLLRTTACHPYYLQLLCYQLFNDLQKGQSELTVAYTEAMLNRWIQESGTIAFLRVLDDTGNSQRNKLILSAIAELGIEDPMVSVESLSKALASSMQEQELVHALDDLTAMAVLKQNRTSYSIEVELLARWLRQRWPLDSLLKGAYV